MSHFTTIRSLDSLEREVLRKGQDLVCIRCRHGLRWTNYDNVIVCAMCGLLRSRNKFATEARQSWEKLTHEPLYCNKCLGIAVTQDETEWTYCNGACQTKLPDWHFIDHMLVDWKARNCQLEVKCARCVLLAQEMPATVHKCVTCKQGKSVTEFSPYAAKD